MKINKTPWLGVVVALGLYVKPLFACGPTFDFLEIPGVAFRWTLILIPFEILFLRLGAQLSWRDSFKAYGLNLSAKVAGFIVTIPAMFFLPHPSNTPNASDLSVSIFVGCMYALIHGIVAALILSRAFDVRGSRLWRTTFLISTVIPWIYMAGVAWNLSSIRG